MFCGAFRYCSSVSMNVCQYVGQDESLPWVSEDHPLKRRALSSRWGEKASIPDKISQETDAFLNLCFLQLQNQIFFNKQRIVRSTKHAMDEANLPLKRLIALATSVCVCAHFFLSIAEDPVTSLQLTFPHCYPKPQWLNNN